MREVEDKEAPASEAAVEESPPSLGGRRFRLAFEAAARWLKRNEAALNAMNVYPVPDGDTGTNMLKTMRAMVRAANKARSNNAGVVARAMARGALMGARGNSGVILAMILEGFTEGLSENESLTGLDFAEGLERGANLAYKRVRAPVEGTILTVVREAAAAARIWAKRPGNLVALGAAVRAARDAVERTPELLPDLRAAGVVDAGGKGLYIILEGALSYLAQGSLKGLVPLVADQVRPRQDFIEALAKRHDAGDESALPFCTQFIVSRASPEVKLDVMVVSERLATMGDSIGVLGNEEVLAVHVHTSNWGAVEDYGNSLGRLLWFKVDDTEAQAEKFAHQAPRDEELGPIGTVAVVSSNRLEDVLLKLGVTVVVRGGGTMNPSMEDILAAIESCSQDLVIVLPGHRNVVMTAQLAADNSTKTVKVVPAESFPKVVAAILALNPEIGLEENADFMEEAGKEVITFEVTKAVRPFVRGGLSVSKEQPIAMRDGELVVASDSVDDAVCSCLALVATPQTGLTITAYYGADVTREKALALEGEIRKRYPNLEITVVHGGQPHYHYIVSVQE